MSIKTLVDGSDLQQAHRLTWFLETPCKGWRRSTIPLDPKKMFGYHKTYWYLNTPLLQVFDGIWRSLDVYGYQVGFPNYYCNRMFQLIALVWRWHMLTIHTPRCSQRTLKNPLHWCSTKICPFNFQLARACQLNMSLWGFGTWVPSMFNWWCWTLLFCEVFRWGQFHMAIYQFSFRWYNQVVATQTCFIFTTTWGKNMIFWLRFFQLGWNHQPV